MSFLNVSNIINEDEWYCWNWINKTVPIWFELKFEWNHKGILQEIFLKNNYRKVPIGNSLENSVKFVVWKKIQDSGWFSHSIRLSESKNDRLPKCQKVLFPSCFCPGKYMIESCRITFCYQSIKITEISIVLI